MAVDASTIAVTASACAPKRWVDLEDLPHPFIGGGRANNQSIHLVPRKTAIGEGPGECRRRITITIEGCITGSDSTMVIDPVSLSDPNDSRRFVKNVRFPFSLHCNSFLFF